MRTLGAVCAAALLLAVSAGTAQATPDVDAAFVAAARGGGITGSVANMIIDAHGVCSYIDDGGHTPLETQRALEAAEAGMDEDHAVWFTIVAITSYCPWNRTLLPGQTDATGHVAEA